MQSSTAIIDHMVVFPLYMFYSGNRTDLSYTSVQNNLAKGCIANCCCTCTAVQIFYVNSVQTCGGVLQWASTFLSKLPLPVKICTSIKCIIPWTHTSPDPKPAHPFLHISQVCLTQTDICSNSRKHQAQVMQSK